MKNQKISFQTAGTSESLYPAEKEMLFESFWFRTFRYVRMEVTAGENDVKIAMPDFIEIVKEVTGDKKYSNASMSKEFPKELI